MIHKAAGETFVRWINANGGLLGRPVEWKLLNDESDPAKVSALYERLISQDDVDLIMGPYATPNIVAAQAVAQRHGYVLPNHTAVLTYALTYDCQFPTWSAGGKPNLAVPQTVFKMLKTQQRPPRRVAFVTNTGGSTTSSPTERPARAKAERWTGHESRATTWSSTSSTRRPPLTGARSLRRYERRSPTSSGTAASLSTRST